jgi:hypothetical protein
MTVENISTASLCLFDCISLSLHNIVDHGVTKSKQYYIKSMAQHDGLSYCRDCVFVVLSGNVASWCFVGCALCITWIGLVFTLRDTHRVLSMFIVAIDHLLKKACC